MAKRLFIIFDFFSPIDVKSAATLLLDRLPNSYRIPGDWLDRYVARQREISLLIGGTDRAQRAFVASAERRALRNRPGIELAWSIEGVEVKVFIMRKRVYIKLLSQPTRQVVRELAQIVGTIGPAEILDRSM
jgi:hypothetical protein